MKSWDSEVAMRHEGSTKMRQNNTCDMIDAEGKTCGKDAVDRAIGLNLTVALTFGKNQHTMDVCPDCFAKVAKLFPPDVTEKDPARYRKSWADVHRVADRVGLKPPVTNSPHDDID